ncbi:MAG: 2-oxoglutarate dehydrogenase, E2 component, dihydrolipoamide succinyltransferase [Melioribacteraceae bacterium]|nr:2-oxoglutarate dehydrogenase, E2 component, dihydrolipoamide succinyltransferase [Melioribacteraceae bacterium]
MNVEVKMPRMGESITEGTLIKWHKKKGDKVQKDEIIFEISTDKVDTEIPSPETGVLLEIKVYENETVEVDTVVAIIETDGQVSSDDVIQKPVLEEEVPSTTQVGGELIDVPMPKMGESVMEGTIIKWHKKVGDKVERDEIIFEISTDKVDTEVPSPAAGTVAEILYNENDTVEVDTVVARISASGGIVKPAKTESKKDEIPADKMESQKQSQIIPENILEDDSKKFFSPLVMNIAKKEGISFEELSRITGTGINGRVTKNDVLKYLKHRESGSTTPVELRTISEELPRQKSVPHFGKDESIKIIPMDKIRQRIMYHMVNSRDTSVHVTGVTEVDMSRVHNYIQKNKVSFQKDEGIKLTYMPFISYACIKALKEYPYLNASIDGDNIVLKKSINLGIAVAVEPNGLIVPNIKHADEKNIKGLAKAIKELSDKSRNKGLLPDDIMEGTFTITNFGVFGSLFGTPIINQPEVGVLGVGAVTKKPVVIEADGQDTIAIKPMMYLSLSHDHRLIDGMLGGLFLRSVKNTLENFDATII